MNMDYLILKTRFTEGTQLPFEVVRGNSESRFEKAKAISKKFAKILDKNVPDDEFCSIKDIDKAIKETLFPNNINICYKREQDAETLAAFQKATRGEQKGNVLNIIIEKFRFAFRTIDSSQKDMEKATAIHEVRHFFDDLFNPKLSVLRFYGMEDKSLREQALPFRHKILNFNNGYSVFSIQKDLKNLSKNMPKKAMVDMLQGLRFSLRTELNAYRDEAKCLIKHPFKNHSRIMIFIHDDILRRQLRLKLITNFLKQTLLKRHL